ADLSVGEVFGQLDSRECGAEQLAVQPCDRTSDQPKTTLTHLVAEVIQHFPRVRAAQPLRLVHRRYSFPNSRSTTQQPRTCPLGWRQWLRRMTSWQPASSKASAKMGNKSNVFSS